MNENLQFSKQRQRKPALSFLGVVQQYLQLLAAVLLALAHQHSIHPLPHQCLGQFRGFVRVGAFRYNLVIHQPQHSVVVHGAVASALFRVLVTVDASENRAFVLLVHFDLQRHGLQTVGAVYLALQPVIKLMPVYMSAAAEYFLHSIKYIFANDGFVGIFNDDLLLLGDTPSFLCLVTDHLTLVVDHVSDVYRVMEHLGQRAGIPSVLLVGVLVQVRCVTGISLQCLVDGRVDDFSVFEFLHNSRERFTSKRQIEEQADDVYYGCIYDQVVVILWINLVTIGRLCSNVHSSIRPLTLGGLDLTRDVLCVHIVHDVFEGGDVIVAALSVDAIINSDVSDAHPAEVDVREVASHDVIAAKAAEIFGDDQVDQAGFDVINQTKKIRPIIGKTGKAIVDIVVNDGQLVFLTKTGEHNALRLNAAALADLLVVFT